MNNPSSVTGEEKSHKPLFNYSNVNKYLKANPNPNKKEDSSDKKEKVHSESQAKQVYSPNNLTNHENTRQDKVPGFEDYKHSTISKENKDEPFFDMINSFEHIENVDFLDSNFSQHPDILAVKQLLSNQVNTPIDYIASNDSNLKEIPNFTQKTLQSHYSNNKIEHIPSFEHIEKSINNKATDNQPIGYSAGNKKMENNESEKWENNHKEKDFINNTVSINRPYRNEVVEDFISVNRRREEEDLQSKSITHKFLEGMDEVNKVNISESRKES
eukprot:CAMPEP_0170525266 /NCGR_PEP_ID=MMETSP0209-20121228/10746_1 /TAXON_ID=665100 ORGANISM="Litonotus pictus, Strain P1" /NCGR_SAMPLE_ID=MMETSP0209 /ASSEMBLY_ACC=CAM_ASM_000301 /LENGTH=271 /DNA_ID=CAMNT_0010814435 /DNA_START=121 /DNA_END=933 /DNA_ORIENTATION=-